MFYTIFLNFVKNFRSIIGMDVHGNCKEEVIKDKASHNVILRHVGLIIKYHLCLSGVWLSVILMTSTKKKCYAKEIGLDTQH